MKPLEHFADLIQLNVWFWLCLAGSLIWFKLDLLSQALNLARLQGADTPQQGNRRNYLSQHASCDSFENALQFFVFIAFWWFGGFAWLNQWSQTWEQSPLVQGTLLIAALVAARALLSLPFNLYSTFVIEQRFGFNRYQWHHYIIDQSKAMILGAVIGAPLIYLILWIFSTFHYAAIWAWCTVTIISAALMYLMPKWILPLFYRFTPLQDPNLKSAIQQLAADHHFPLQEVYVVDGSKRSTKANAFFIGFGNNRRIALYDTLLNTHPQQEILAVLAHEIGHYRCRHIRDRFLASLVSQAIFFASLQLCMQHADNLNAAFGVQNTAAVWPILFFSIISGPYFKVLNMLSLYQSRVHEYQADAFAKQALQSEIPMIQALERLSENHQSHPDPHPLREAMYATHPSSAKRIQALRQ